MAWFALGRIMFVVIVAYAAALLQPLSAGVPANIGFGLTLAALVVLFEGRLRETAVTKEHDVALADLVLRVKQLVG